MHREGGRFLDQKGIRTINQLEIGIKAVFCQQGFGEDGWLVRDTGDMQIFFFHALQTFHNPGKNRAVFAVDDAVMFVKQRHGDVHGFFRIDGVEVNGQGAADQILGALADEHPDGRDIDRRKIQVAEHAVERDIQIRNGIDHGAIQVENDEPDIM